MLPGVLITGCVNADVYHWFLVGGDPDKKNGREAATRSREIWGRMTDAKLLRTSMYFRSVAAFVVPGERRHYFVSRL